MNGTNHEHPHCEAFSTLESHPSWARIFASGSQGTEGRWKPCLLQRRPRKKRIWIPCTWFIEFVLCWLVVVLNPSVFISRAGRTWSVWSGVAKSVLPVFRVITIRVYTPPRLNYCLSIVLFVYCWLLKGHSGVGIYDYFSSSSSEWGVEKAPQWGTS